MEQIRLKSNQLINSSNSHFRRSIAEQIDWNDRLIGILGARGLGKTTILLQQANRMYSVDSKALYINLDDIYFAGKTLHEFAVDFRNKGGDHLFIDEIHKYPNWSSELKQIHDTLPDLKVVFVASSTIEMVKHYTNLSKRATIYTVQGLSFREYLAMENIATLPIVDLSSIINNHQEIARELSEDNSVLLHFDKYLTRGYYPFQANSYEEYKRQMEQVVYQTIEADLAYMEGYDPHKAYKMRQLLNVIAQNVPFKPNLVKISEQIGVHRNTLIGYFFHLEKAKLIQLLYPSGSIISILQKPQEVLLNNPNLAQLICDPAPTRENILRTFLINQVSASHPLKVTNRSTVDVDGKWTIAVEVAKAKTKRKYKLQNTHVFADDIEIGNEKRIPIWLAGLGY